LELPSALELEALSDSELEERINLALSAINALETVRGDDSYEQRLFRALETDQSRRHAMAGLSEKGSV
jgi:hypothetical protein